MKVYLTIFSILITGICQAQSRTNFVYICPWPNNASIGLDHAVQLTKKEYSSGRFYFVVSPNFLWTGYNQSPVNEQPEQNSKFSQYEFALPIHFRYEFAPYRIAMGSKPGKRDQDFSIFFDAGISLNYILAANLMEQYNYTGSPGFQYTFDGSITNTIDNRFSCNYLTINFGFRLSRFVLVLRHYEPFVATTYQNITPEWGKPRNISSYFYDQYLVQPFYKQGTTLLCIGYTF